MIDSQGDDGHLSERSNRINVWKNVHRAKLARFLKEYSDVAEGTEFPIEGENLKYPRLAVELATANGKTLAIDLQDVRSYSELGDDFVDFITHYYFDVAADVDDISDNFVKIVLGDRHYSVHSKSLRFYGAFYGLASVHSLRTLRCDLLSGLTAVRGTVTRTSDVRPELRWAGFECDTCHSVIENVEQQFKFTEPTVCPTKACGNRSTWILRPEMCQFNDWQKIRIQENASEIPAGSIPRSMDFIVRNDNCEKCKAGDKVVVTGCLIVVPDVPNLMKPGEIPKTVSRDKQQQERSEYGMLDNTITGLRALGVRDLGYKLCFLATRVSVLNAAVAAGVISDNTAPDQLGPDIEQIAQSRNVMDTLAKNIAPEIYGHDEIKKGLLLMLVGGVEKRTEKEGAKLRGDINVCIVGDPGTAKSQLLKYVQRIAGRAVYTSGKTSTAAGLTASVHKDADQGDSVIEAGALMLADKGVCCIDEFDKMDEKDMVAIHEAMEQQTISICKAGIQATLNARASVLAACNPALGRYDVSKPFRQNVRLSAPIMSRFDLFFVMLDETDEDQVIAQHMVKMHADPEGFGQAARMPMHQLQAYIRHARELKPLITPQAKDALVRTYVQLRQQEARLGSRNNRMTVRQLESLIRLSEAIAKLHFSHEVTPDFVLQARQIFQNSMTKVKKNRLDLGEDVGENFEAQQDDEDDETYSKRMKAHEEARYVDADEYRLAAQVIYDYVLWYQQTESTDGMERDEVIAWFVDEHMQVDDEDDLSTVHWKADLILQRMMRDCVLWEEDREVVLRADEGELATEQFIVKRFVGAHPNFDPDEMFHDVSVRGRRHHTKHPSGSKLHHTGLDMSYYQYTVDSEGNQGLEQANDADFLGKMDDNKFVESFAGHPDDDADMSMS